MKKILFILFSISVSAQVSEFKNKFHGNVKVMEVREMNDQNPPQERISVTEFDRQKRKIRETSGYGSKEEFWYKTNSDKEFSLKKSFDSETNKSQTFTVIDRDQKNRIILQGTKYNSDWGSFYINNYEQNSILEHHFYNSEISLITETKLIDLATYKVSPHLVPFVWDKILSKAYETLQTNFPDGDKKRQMHF